jgi:hypothetical protein
MVVGAHGGIESLEALGLIEQRVGANDDGLERAVGLP